MAGKITKYDVSKPLSRIIEKSGKNPRKFSERIKTAEAERKTIMSADPADFTEEQFEAINRGLERHRDYSEEAFLAAMDASDSARYARFGRANMTEIVTV